MKQTNRSTLAEIASRIHGHLRRLAADPQSNPRDRQSGHCIYYRPTAEATARLVRITYVEYQASLPLTRAEAERYLAWLDAGNTGTHWEALSA